MPFIILSTFIILVKLTWVDLRRATGICAGTNLVRLIHSRPRSIDWNIWPVTTSLRRRYPSLRLLCTVVCGVIFITDFAVCGCRCGVDEIKQATVKSSQDRGPVMYNEPSSSSAAIDSNADRWRSSHPDAERAWPRHLHRQRPFYADACSANDVELLRCPPPATTDPSIFGDGHIPDADSRSRQPMAGLREHHAGWHSSLPHAQIAVSTERTAHLPSQALRSRHRCTRQSTLDACTGENQIQDSRADIQSSPWWRTTLPGAVHFTADVPGRRALRSAGTNQLVVPPVWLFTFGSRAFPVAAAQIWNSAGTHRLSPHVAVLQASLENVFTTTVFLSIALSWTL